MKKFTTNDLATVLGVEKPVAYNLIQFLSDDKVNIATKVSGSRKKDGKQGRGEALYVLDENALEKVVGLVTSIMTAAPTVEDLAEAATPATPAANEETTVVASTEKTVETADQATA